MSTVTDKDAKDAVSRNVKARLAEKGWSQAQLARATGENEMTISFVCRGIHVPGVGLLSRIADALECTVDSLLAATAKKSAKSSRRPIDAA